jgi:hypothetical protein
MVLLFGGHVWKGESGERYRFKVVLTKDGLPRNDRVGGIYVFVRRRWVFFLEPLYVGKATSFQERLLGHEKWGRAYWFYGATERHIMEVEGGNERAKIEEDLIRSLKPRMNDQMVPRKATDAPSNRALREEWREKQWWRDFWWGKKRVGVR